MKNKTDFENFYAYVKRYIKKYSYINGQIDEDLQQELCIKAYKCFKKNILDAINIELIHKQIRRKFPLQI